MLHGGEGKTSVALLLHRLATWAPFLYLDRRGVDARTSVDGKHWTLLSGHNVWLRPRSSCKR